MPGLLPGVDPDGLLEYSVVYTDRALNHMSASFQRVMREISSMLKTVYNAEAVAIVPGGGTYGMEAVARQLATGKRCLVVRNGWFSYRWSQILEMGNIPTACEVLKARPCGPGPQAPYEPPSIDELTAAIETEKPAVVFAPHVETASGILLPEDYIRRTSDAVHKIGGLLVLDCIASGALWVSMQSCGVDVLISAPQKCWSGSPCCAMVMLSEKAKLAVESTQSTSYACDLKKWLQIMQTYENGGHAYHATMPTDGLRVLWQVMREAREFGFPRLSELQVELGTRARALLTRYRFKSVAAEGFQAPGVIVSYTDDPEIHNGKRFIELGLQVTAGVPLQLDEPEDFRTFRIGLFGLDKLRDVDGVVSRLEQALARLTR